MASSAETVKTKKNRPNPRRQNNYWQKNVQRNSIISITHHQLIEKQKTLIKVKKIREEI